MQYSDLDNVTFVFVDVETTGLCVEWGDRICEIALLKWRNGEELATYQTLINPEREISPGAASVNNITSEMVKDAPTFPQIAEEMLKFMEGTALVAHHAPFDMGFLQTQLVTSGFPPIENPLIDTLAIARKHYRFPNNSLGTIALYYGLDTKGAHRAMADVLLTRQIFERFVNDLKEQGATTLSHLIEAQGGPVRAAAPEEAVLPPEVQDMIASGRPLKVAYMDAGGRVTERVLKVVACHFL